MDRWSNEQLKVACQAFKKGTRSWITHMQSSLHLESAAILNRHPTGWALHVTPDSLVRALSEGLHDIWHSPNASPDSRPPHNHQHHHHSDGECHSECKEQQQRQNIYFIHSGAI
jgi:hypothetical protein